MKTDCKSSFTVTTLIAGFSLLLAGRIAAQDLTQLHSFPMIGSPNAHNSDGTGPSSGVVLANGTLFGLTAAGGGKLITDKNLVFARPLVLDAARVNSTSSRKIFSRRSPRLMTWYIAL